MPQSFIRLLYNVLLVLLLILGAPWWVYCYATSERFRTGLSKRFFGPSKAFAAALPQGPRIWLHAVSVGEVLAISSLVRELEMRAPEYSLVISTTTRTGQALARQCFDTGRANAGRTFYCPLDFPWSIAATLNYLRPSMLVLAESELWPNLLAACRRAQVPVLVVNARVSDRSLPRYLKLRLLWQPFLQMLTKVLTQTAEDARRFAQIGVPADRIEVGGNLKFDVRAPQSSALTTRVAEHLTPHARLLVCGSTLEGEEALLLGAWREVVVRVPEAVLVLAPRHPERFDQVASLLAASPLLWVRRSQWFSHPQPLAPGSVFLLDSIGELASLYSLASVAVIGGSLVPSGGHNPLEAAQWGVPIAMGPHYENFRDIVQSLIEQDGIRIVDPQACADALRDLLQQKSTATRLGANAKKVFEEQAGAARRAATVILELMSAERRA